MVVKRIPKQEKAPHLVIEALAGAGKSFTLLHGLNILKGKPGWGEVQGSPQQEAVWDALCKEKPQGAIAMCAFNKSIATELQNKVPVGVVASTLHSMGFKAVTAAFGKVKVDGWKISNIVQSLSLGGKDTEKFKVITIEKIVGLLKMNLLEPTVENMELICQRYGIDMNGDKGFIFDKTPEVMHLSLEMENIIDFNDMVWFPVAKNLPIEKYQLLMVDESQDLNKCQQQLVYSAGERIIAVGDKNQSIYGFSGADTDSIDNLIAHLGSTPRGVTRLPLTVTRRCPKAVVTFCQTLVPTFEAMPEASLGEILDIEAVNFGQEVKERDMVLCRTNAPLVSRAFQCLKVGKSVKIQGRDIGKGLITLINKLKGDSIPDLQAKLEDYRQRETQRLMKARGSEMQIAALDDKIECIQVFMEGKNLIQEVVRSIETLFDDAEKIGSFILFSSVHRAKGLEAKRVFVLCPELMPFPKARSEEDRKQEKNLQYVCWSRSLDKLIFVRNSQPEPKQDKE